MADGSVEFQESRTKNRDLELFTALMKAAKLDTILEEKRDTHICSQCTSAFTGLFAYLEHRLQDCTKSLVKTDDSVFNKKNTRSTSKVQNRGSLGKRSITRQDNKISAKKRVSRSPVARHVSESSTSSGDDPGFADFDDDDSSSNCTTGSVPKSQNLGLSNDWVVRLEHDYKKSGWECIPCNLPFSTKDELVRHLGSSKHWTLSKDHPLHTSLILGYSNALAPLAPYKCTICAFYFNEFKEFMKHWIKEREIHISALGENRKFVCSLCEYKSWTNEDMVRHLTRTAHKIKASSAHPLVLSVASQLCCSKCDWTCRRQQALLAHMQWKHSDKEEPFSDDKTSIHELVNLTSHNDVDFIPARNTCIPVDGNAEGNRGKRKRIPHPKSISNEKPMDDAALAIHKLLNQATQINAKIARTNGKQLGRTKAVTKQNGNKEQDKLGCIVEETIGMDNTVEIEISDNTAGGESAEGNNKSEIEESSEAATDNVVPMIQKLLNQAMAINAAIKAASESKRLKKSARNASLSKTKLEQNVSKKVCKYLVSGKSDVDVEEMIAAVGVMQPAVVEETVDAVNVMQPAVVEETVDVVNVMQPAVVEKTVNAVNVMQPAVSEITVGGQNSEEGNDMEIEENSEAEEELESEYERESADSSNDDDDDSSYENFIKDMKKVCLKQKRGRPKECHYCKQLLKDRSDRENHIATMHPEKLLRCEPCCAVFHLESQMRLHLKSKLHYCCTKDLRDIEKGILKQAAEFPCNICTFHTATKAGIIFHQMLHNPKRIMREVTNGVAEDNALEEISVQENEKETCTNAEIGADEAITDKPKAKTYRARGKRFLYACPICDKHFSPVSLRNHLPKHTGEQIFECKQCSESFSQKTSLMSHMRTYHKIKMLKCSQCSYRTNRRNCLDKHLIVHEKDRVKEFLCTICGTTFYTKEGVQKHMRLHTANKGRNFPCTFEGCTKAFTSASELSYHTRTHTKEAPFLCETCGYATKTKVLLKRHVKRHLKLKPYKCEFCSYASLEGSKLQRHMKIHCQVKPYSCPYCKYTSNTQGNIRKHVLSSKLHEGMSVYPCRHCAFGSNSAEEIKMHTINTHPEIASKYDVDDLGFSSLVTGIFNPEADKKVPSELPPPYVPRAHRKQTLNKMYKKAQGKTSSSSSDERAISSSDEEEQAVKETPNETCKAIENLIEISKRQEISNTPSEKPAAQTAVESSTDYFVKKYTTVDIHPDIFPLMQVNPDEPVEVIVEGEEVVIYSSSS